MNNNVYETPKKGEKLKANNINEDINTVKNTDDISNQNVDYSVKAKDKIELDNLYTISEQNKESIKHKTIDMNISQYEVSELGNIDTTLTSNKDIELGEIDSNPKSIESINSLGNVNI